ncbi:hypothetical protein [Flavobacterium cerinum]|uniref:Glycine zipper family protein n=1 Tax=Flavobacterium cerinum TaxID=2502784 RepID=A0ABY5IWH1_9FLAO|nr:hypothetical protein [Flavobacterium cerinum]UUC45857.1 hypothetical protein NOX80_01325 [Flavobacterium cerinum]
MKKTTAKSTRYLLSILILSVLSVSCSGIQNTRMKSQLYTSNCNQQNVYNYTADQMPQPIHTLTVDSVLATQLSFRSLNVANAIGVLDLMSDYVAVQKKYKKNPTIENRLTQLEMAQKLNQRINNASLEVSAVSSEMDCEEERTSQIADFLKGKEDETESKLTVGAIIIGATGAIASGLLIDKGNTGDYIGLGTGITEATLGLLILRNKRNIEFYHHRNALRDIWEGHPVSAIFPPAVWYYLNYSNPNESEKVSFRREIIEKWMNFGQIADEKSKKKTQLLELYFGNGGKYSAQELDNRANMYDQLESQINLMKQDLKALSTELEKIKI